MKANYFPSDLYFLGKLLSQLRSYGYGTVPTPVVKKMTFKLRFARNDNNSTKRLVIKASLGKGGLWKKRGGWSVKSNLTG